MTALSIVAIGRNEGERLEACLRSLPADATRIYVDSGSTDGSVALAERLGVSVLTMPQGTPFTAALARNSGLALVDRSEGALVQMIDGDCSLDRGWLEAAIAAMLAEPDLAVVFGRRRERFPERSIYNRMCDDEWNVPVGEARACGGDALFRVAALEAVGGYDPGLIAGEEPDLCLRLRARGWRVRRIGAEMTLHDAAMTRFGQWWRRTERSGHAFAELAWRHGASGDPHWTRETRSILAWGLALPLAILLVGVAVSWWAALVLALAVPAQMARIGWRMRHAALAFFLVLGKVPQAKGLLRFHWRRLRSIRSSLIEYKGAETRSA